MFLELYAGIIEDMKRHFCMESIAREGRQALDDAVPMDLFCQKDKVTVIVDRAHTAFVLSTFSTLDTQVNLYQGMVMHGLIPAAAAEAPDAAEAGASTST